MRIVHDERMTAETLDPIRRWCRRYFRIGYCSAEWSLPLRPVFTAFAVYAILASGLFHFDSCMQEGGHLEFSVHFNANPSDSYGVPFALRHLGTGQDIRLPAFKSCLETRLNNW